jgi:hypothetical protein
MSCDLSEASLNAIDIENEPARTISLSEVATPMTHLMVTLLPPTMIMRLIIMTALTRTTT